MPMLNGFPIRLVVPGWYATYWVKALNDITVLAEPFKGFWMDKAYRVPAKDPHARETPDKLATDTEPISAMTTRSLIVKPEDGQQLARGIAVEVQGVAIDDGSGIETVEVSTDGGKIWNPARLDADLGKYSWRRWRYPWTPAVAGTSRIMARATNAKGQTQETEQWNHSGYARDVIEHIDVTIA
jgi:sulfite dehydrogenase